MVKGKAWLGIKDPPAGEGQVGQKQHCRAVTSPLPEEEGLGEKVELSLQERRRGRKVSTVGRFSSSSLRGEDRDERWTLP